MSNPGYMSIVTSTPPATPTSAHRSTPSGTIIARRRNPSVSLLGPTGGITTAAIALPAVYSANRFRRRFRATVLWSIVAGVAVLLLTTPWARIDHFDVRARGQQVLSAERAFNGTAVSGGRLLAVANAEEGQDDDEEEVRQGGPTTLEVGHDGSLASLPACRKTFLFRFAGLHGQGSELNLLLRLAILANRFDFTFLVDSSAWNYGPFTTYFEPIEPTLPLAFPSNGSPSLRCRPPASETKRLKVRLTQDDLERLEHDTEDQVDGDGGDGWVPTWAREGKHVVWGPQRDMDGLDQTVLKLFANSTSIDELHRSDSERLRAADEEAFFARLGGLDERETLPSAFENAFERLSDQAKRVWRLNGQVQAMVDALDVKLELPSRASAERETRDRRAGDLVIGVHVRLGDKYLEKDRIGPSQGQAGDSDPAVESTVSPYSASYTADPGLDVSTVLNYFAAAIKSVNHLLGLPSSVDSAPFASTATGQVDYLMTLSDGWYARQGEVDVEVAEKPTMLLMSDDQGAVDKFKQHPLARRFRIVGTSGEDTGPIDGQSRQTATERDETRMLKVVVTSRDRSVKREANRGVVVVAQREFVQSKASGQRRDGHDGLGRGRSQRHGKIAHQALPKKPQGPVIPPGFNEVTFNSLPLSDRIDQSRRFVRDVTFVSTRSDALVMTGSSNVGRLMSLLMGEKSKGNVRSLDTRWFPTAKFS
ncbi:hypothetical protein JCM3766R1_003288 [Sporobolomyces carnicolor]